MNKPNCSWDARITLPGKPSPKYLSLRGMMWTSTWLVWQNPVSEKPTQRLHALIYFPKQFLLLQLLILTYPLQVSSSAEFS